jgi:hypothetical protein
MRRIVKDSPTAETQSSLEEERKLSLPFIPFALCASAVSGVHKMTILFFTGLHLSYL